MTYRGFALAAALGLGRTVLAQVDDACVLPAIPIAPDMIRGGGQIGGYTPRDLRVVYRLGTSAQSGGDWRSSGSNTYDDVTFGGPGASGPLEINAIAFGIITPIAIDPADDHLYMKVSFFPNHDNTVAATAPPYSGTPVIWNLDIGSNWGIIAGSIVYYPDPVVFSGPPALLNSTNVFNGGPGDRTCGVYQQLFLDPAMTRSASNWQIARRGLWTVPSVGSSDFFGWFAGATGGATYAIVNSERSGGTQATARATYLALAARFAPCRGECAADFDDGSGTGAPDGGVTIDDLLYYLGIFGSGLSCADLDDGSGAGILDGGVTIDDLLYFLVRFAQGC